MEIVKLPTAEPKSSQSYIDLLRLYIDLAHEEELEFLEISVKASGKPLSSISIRSGK